MPSACPGKENSRIIKPDRDLTKAGKPSTRACDPENCSTQRNNLPAVFQEGSLAGMSNARHNQAERESETTISEVGLRNLTFKRSDESESSVAAHFVAERSVRHTQFLCRR